MRIFIGIDPGQSGGIAQVTEGGHFLCWPIQDTERDTWNLFDGGPIGSYKDSEDTLKSATRLEMSAVIEEAHSMPGQGVASMFTFGRSYGLLRGFLWASGIPFHTVTPKKWQSAFGMKRKKTERPTEYKKRLRQLAQGLAPNCKVTNKEADAILLAEYLRRFELRI